MAAHLEDPVQVVCGRTSSRGYDRGHAHPLHVVPGAAGALSAVPLLVVRHYGWVVRFMNGRVVGVLPLERR